MTAPTPAPDHPLPDHPLPTQGGSFTRAADGSLAPTTPDAPKKKGVQAPVQTPAETPVKEG